MKFRTVVMAAVGIVAVFAVLLICCLLTLSGSDLTLWASFLGVTFSLITVFFAVAVQAHTESASARYRQMYGREQEEKDRKGRGHRSVSSSIFPSVCR